MPWKEVSAMSARLEFVSLASQSGANVSLLAKRFGISRPTAYKWLARHRAATPEPLVDKSRRPLSSPIRTGDDTEQLVLQARDQHPAWGGRKLRAYLRNQGHADIPAASTITAILRRHQRLDSPRAGVPRDWQRFEHPSPNDLWQMDFKGHVAMTDGKRCHPLTVLDDHSRYALGLVACPNETFETVQQSLAAIFRRYGLPARMLMDNGAPWGDTGGQPLTVLTVWLLRLGIRISHGRPYHPQTQGKDERFHRTLNAEVLARRTLTGLGDAQQHFDHWRNIYNRDRPHEALALATPATRYRPSPRAYPEVPPPIEYLPGDAVRTVQTNGVIGYRNRRFRISHALVRQSVALRPRSDGTLAVWFGTCELGTLDLDRGVLVRPTPTRHEASSRGATLAPQPSPEYSS
jgi:transposase InsO family protein